jgi:predicted dehydrogenase
MSDPKDGMNYAPEGGAVRAVVGKGEFEFAAMALDHGHIQGMCKALIEAGADLKWVYDADPARVAKFREKFPQARAAENDKQILEDESVRLVAAAAVPNLRCALGMRVMDHGKHYFTDKAPMTTLEQLAQARAKVRETKKNYAIYYSERVHNEAGTFIDELIAQGRIGRVVQVIGTGPHRCNPKSRPDWFFRKEQYGGILIDIASHQTEQFLHLTGNKNGRVACSHVANYRFKEYPELEDFGDATVVGENGASGYFRVDWLTPDGLRAFGDGRLIILGTEGFIEVRKYVDLAREGGGNQVFLCDHKGEQVFQVKGKYGYPYFGRLILDCINGTSTAMDQEHAFKAIELALVAQERAVRLE